MSKKPRKPKPKKSTPKKKAKPANPGAPAAWERGAGRLPPPMPIRAPRKPKPAPAEAPGEDDEAVEAPATDAPASGE